MGHPGNGRRPGAALGTYEVISDPVRPGKCLRASKSLRLKSSDGTWVKVRCRATNRCDYCAIQAAWEQATMLTLDALEGVAPAVWCVLGTRSADHDPASFYRAREQFWKAVKRRYPNAEYAALVEFTTGFGPRSGGLRRPHWNVLIKGVPVSEISTLRALVDRIWCGRVDAEPAYQHVGSVTESGGLIHYIALHFQKASQRPPKGWSGHRFMTSRGYFAVSAAEMRRRAKPFVQRRRELWKAGQRLGANADPELVAMEVEAAIDQAQARTWEVWAVKWSPAAPDVFMPDRALAPRRKRRRVVWCSYCGTVLEEGSGCDCEAGAVLTARALERERAGPGLDSRPMNEQLDLFAWRYRVRRRVDHAR